MKGKHSCIGRDIIEDYTQKIFQYIFKNSDFVMRQKIKEPEAAEKLYSCQALMDGFIVSS